MDKCRNLHRGYYSENTLWQLSRFLGMTQCPLGGNLFHNLDRIIQNLHSSSAKEIQSVEEREQKKMASRNYVGGRG